MDLFSIIKLLGGIAFFLFGMELLSDGLEKVSGGRLEQTLEKMTSNRFMGLLLGTIVTGVIQSSAATTVMVIGFVNSGIMKLKQTIGIIMGANIGTTVTAWLFTLAGIDDSNPYMQFLKPSSFTPLLAFIAIILIMFSKRNFHHNIAYIMIGFAILMSGLDIMGDSVGGLSESQVLKDILQLFGTNPILGILAGAIITALIQSSSATIGILATLAAETGLITYHMALPIIMGMNIGSCIVALISCISAKKVAKRVAFIHLYFNIIGTVIWCSLYAIVNAIHHITFFDNSVGYMEIAIIASIFNIITTAILFPCAGLLEKLAYLTIRDNGEESNLPFIDERFLDTPSIATEQCKEMAYKMAELSKTSYIKALNLIGNYDEKIFDEIVDEESLVDTYEDVLGSYLVKLSSKSLNSNDSRTISKLLLSINDFERISDHAVNIATSAKEMHEKKIMFSEMALTELEVIKNAVIEVLENTVASFVTNSTKVASSVEPLEQVVDRLQEKIKERHIARLQNGKCTVKLGFILSDVITSLQRVSDHCSNIAVCVIQINLKQFETHEYLQELKSSDGYFKEEYNKYKLKYTLPVTVE